MPTVPELRIGVVAGATSTDAVALDARDRLLGSVRVAAGPDTARTAAAAVAKLVDDAALHPAHVRAVTLGTGYEMDDIVASQRVRRVAVVRIGAPLTLAVPPLATWPPRLRRQVSAGEIVVGGGAEYDGGSMTPLDEDALARFLACVADRAAGVAITAVFSPVAPEHELVAAAVARRELGCAVHVSLSHEISTVGLLERENATVLNAALRGTATQLAGALRAALAEQRLDAELYFAQNDGTIMSADHALRYPALMIAGGPGISMRGAAHLSGVGDAVVLDVGGTSAAVGVLVNGAPRERSTATDIAGVRTSLRLPDVARVPFGSGSTIAHDGEGPTLGPGSVGLRLTEEALAFGGSTPTLTDAAVAAGRARVGTVALGAAQRRELQPALA
ncbi:MAG: hydantoinase/oxoprolinase family protein, partial [Solirubrobacteraceae bacterium]